ncbi:NADH:flavin oxidoreductase [Alteribacillus sp. YIM 98480]|uniref:oxidoreductase n=1 Tax=Alteribacillus sp. YIM 98480 TaxID=2606599 RepID=UPI00131D465F|nr:NADH:flavin oxidoreductase [Alteribacillus sp. YIM 98480]
MSYNSLFSDFTIAGSKLKNRFVVAPMTRVSAEEDGCANDRMKQYYERYAKGGFSMVISEGIYLDESYSQGYYNQPGLAAKKHAESWKPVVDAVQQHGSIFIAQLMHAGAQGQGNAYADETIAPSEIAPKGEQLEFYGGSGPFPVPRQMTEQDITDAKQAFVNGAVAAKNAGFDGVEIHGANGYLLDQFLTEYLNTREDHYGGSLENRLRLFLEIIQDIRTAVGDDFIVGIRVSQIKVSDAEHKWSKGETDAEYIFSTLGKTSLDYIHTTDGDATESSFGKGTKTLANAAKTYGKLPVIANGKLGDPEKANTFMEKEEADLVSLGTSALANPDFPNRVKLNVKLNSFDFENILLPKAFVKDHELHQDINME